MMCMYCSTPYFHAMLYGLLKIWVRLGLQLFAVRIRIEGAQQLRQQGPLVLAVNHPNSFLDAILIGTFMQQPVHFLTRGDVFKRTWVRKLLHTIHMIPVYRVRDGKDKLSLNEQTFRKSEEVLQKGGILLVFVEGFCEHQTTLQLPLKKGASRVIDACWRQGVPVRILPVWLRYSSFWQYAKHMDIMLGQVITPMQQVQAHESAWVCNRINEKTASELARLEAATHQLPPPKPLPTWQKNLLALPALLGAVLHAPLYLPVQSVVYRYTRHEVHYDSVLLAVLLLLYPLCLLVLAFLLATATQWYFFMLPLILLPLLARAFVVWK